MTSKRNWTLTAAVAVLAGWLAVGLLGCGGNQSSPGVDAKELERAFGLAHGAAPSEGDAPPAVASRAVAFLNAQSWINALSILDWMRKYANLTADQAHAVQNAYANVSVRVTELAAKGNPEARATLDRAKQEADRR